MSRWDGCYAPLPSSSCRGPVACGHLMVAFGHLERLVTFGHLEVVYYVGAVPTCWWPSATFK